MTRRIMTVVRFQETERLIAQSQTDRAIAWTLRCRRDKAAEIRRGEARDPPKAEDHS